MPRPPVLFLIFFLLAAAAHGQHYKKLHRKSVVIDTHNDVISTVSMRGLAMDTDLRGKAHTDVDRLREGGIDIQVFSVFSDERFGKDTAFRYANIEIDSLYAVIGRNEDKMMLVTTPAGLKKALREKKTGCMIGVEGGHMIEDRLDYLDALFQRGARYLTLTWNHSTSWASSAWFEVRNKDSLHRTGLTPFGEEVVRRMNRLGMIIDVSHVGEQTIRDVLAITTKPVIASHSCAHALCPVPRNLKDEQIRAIASNGGVIHLNFYSGFIDSNYNRNKNLFLARHQQEVDSLLQLKWPQYEVEEWISEKYREEAEALRPPLSMLLDHLDHIVRLVGVDHVGLGSDFDGIESAPKGLDDVSSYPQITKALIKRGYSRKDIRKILGGNFLRVFIKNSTD